MESWGGVVAHRGEAIARSIEVSQVKALYRNALAAFEKLTVAGFALELTLIDHDCAARQNCLDDAFDRLAFVSAVIDVHMMSLDADRLIRVRIEDDDVRVRANSDRAFLRKQPEHLRRSSRSELDKAIERDSILNHAVVDERDTVLDAGRAIRNFREVILAQLLLLFHAEGAVIG